MFSSCLRQESRAGGGPQPPAAARKHRLQVQLTELEGVTLSNGVLFAKVRLVGGGRFCQYSARKEIRENKVVWSDQGPMEFACRLGGPGPCSLRVSVRKEERGGRSYSKLGFAVLDLTALGRPAADGSGEWLLEQEHSCILSPYSQRQRLDNSTLRLSIRRIPAAQMPAAHRSSSQLASAAATAVDGGASTFSTDAAAAPAVAADGSASATAAAAATAASSSVAATSVDPAVTAAAAAGSDQQQLQPMSHKRNPSALTGPTTASTYSMHSRTNSVDAQQSLQQLLLTPQSQQQQQQQQQQAPLPADGLLHPTNSSQSSSALSFDALPSSLERKRATFTPYRDQLSSRIVNTRTDNYKIVREVLEKEGIRIVSPAESLG